MRVALGSYQSRCKLSDFFRGLFSPCCGSNVDAVVNPASEFVSLAEHIESLTPSQYEMQSGEVALNPIHDDKNAHLSVETVQFLDEVSGQESGLSANKNTNTSDGVAATPDLAEFLRRPVRIWSFTWLETDTAGTVYPVQPWREFFNDARIRYKLNNFAYIRCNLKLKILINASPFYYGAMLASYNPMQTLNGNYVPLSGVTPPNILIPYSQRPRAWIYPQNSEGATMTLPFFHYKNWLRINKAQDFFDMGEIDFFVYAALAQANGVTGSGVTVQVYAWAEDVELAGATVGLSMQSGKVTSIPAGKDEYDGPVSGPASAVANIAGRLSGAPVIGKFATAAQVGASAIARVSSMFGYSNPPVISDSRGMKPQAFPVMSSPEISFPSEKLALDPKNELSIDRSIVGLPSQDELAISYLAQKESYLCQTTWDAADAVDKILFSSHIAPIGFFASETIPVKANGQQVYHTPLSWLSCMFNSWRGDVIFRFKVVASQYHKGRLRISWDPQGYAAENIYTDAVSATVVQTAIIDIGKDTDVEFRIPYNQATSFLRQAVNFVPGSQGWSVSATPTWNMVDTAANGVLTLRVLTTLTGPISTANIPIMVFVRGAENMEFANPGFTDSNYWSSFDMQSGSPTDIPIGDQPTEIVAGKVSSPDNQINLSSMGEKVESLRTVLARPNYYYTYGGTSNTTDDHVSIAITQNKLPMGFGFDLYGKNFAVGQYDPLSHFKFNFVKQTAIDWILSAFIGVRGSTHWIIQADSPDYVNNIRVFRRPNEAFTSYDVTTTLFNNLGVAGVARSANLVFQNGMSGLALTNQRTQAGISVVVPQYSNLKFISANAQDRSNAATVYDQQAYEAFTTQICFNGKSSNAGKAPLIHFFVGAGNDFTPVFWLNAPALYRYTAIPAAYP